MEKERESKNKGILSEMLAYTGTAVASTLSIWASIRHYAYRNMRNNAFKDIYEKRIEDEAILDNKASDFLKKYTEIESKYTKDIDARYARIGVRSSRVLGSWDKFRNCLSGFEQAKVAVLGLTVSSVAMVAYFNMQHKREIAEQLKKMNQNQESKQQLVR